MKNPDRVLWLAGLVMVLALPRVVAQRVIQPPEDPTRRLGLALRKIGVEGRLLYVTAHPDDEDNALLAYFGHRRGMSCMLLTLTRGEGGQNEIGEEEGEALAVLRMQELREAHRYDGAAQCFSRAIDFGYSFSEEETFRKWGRDEILRDVVQIVREVRPHVILTMPAKAEGGGRHHQASALLAREAFAAASTAKWPELGAPWAADRLFEQAWDGKEADRDLFEVPVEDYDPLLGCTYAEIGFRARSMHKCQGTPQVDRPSAQRRRSRWRLVLARGDVPPAGSDLFHGLDVGATLRIEGADPLDPDGARKVLRRLLDARPTDGRVKAALALSSPILIEALAGRDTIHAGETLDVDVFVHNRSRDALRIGKAAVEARLRINDRPSPFPLEIGLLAPGERRALKIRVPVPPDADAPTWVILERAEGVDRYLSASSVLPETGLAWVSAVVEESDCEFRLPVSWVVNRREDRESPTAMERVVALKVSSTHSGPPGALVFSERPVTHPHVRMAILGPRKELRPVPDPSEDLLPPKGATGVIRGFGPRIDGLGSPLFTKLREIDELHLFGAEWKSLHTLVVDERAYESCRALKEQHRPIEEWMQAGGHLVVLYQKPEGMNEGQGDAAQSPFMPYPARIGRGRTTDESAPVTVLVPDHRFFRSPHPIREADWQRWVQDRGLYYLETKDDRYQNLLEIEDPFPANAGRKTGSLVTAAVGKGRWTYVGLALGRQLRAGVPGAWRLLANILAP